MRIFSAEAEGSKKHKVKEILIGSACVLLLVVFAIPIVFQNKSSHRSICISNLKQLSTSVLIYESDNEDKIPPYFTFESTDKDRAFFKSIDVYSKNPQIYFCPFDKDQSSSHAGEPGREGVPGLNSYVHCLSLRGVIPGYSEGKRVLNTSEKSVDPAQTPYLRDPVRGSAEHDGKSVLASPQGASFTIAYLDGHAKVRTPIDIGKEL